MSPTTPNTEIDADVMAAFERFDNACQYWYGVGNHEEEYQAAGVHLQVTIAKTIQFFADKANHFESHFQRVARDHGPSNRELDTARREWAKRGEK